MNWIPVTESLPDDEINVMVATEYGEVCEATLHDERWLLASGNYIVGGVTHWMHFPAPPQKDRKRDRRFADMPDTERRAMGVLEDRRKSERRA